MSNESHIQLLEALHECMTACNHCYDACLKEEHDMSECIRLDIECANICSFLEQAISRGTPYLSDLARLCAKICRDCAEECSRHDHEHCQKCAEACRKCAEACEGAA